MAKRFGFDSFGGTGKETTWGTSVARTKFFEIVIGGERGGLDPGRRFIESMRQRVATAHFDIGKKGLKGLVSPLTYEKFLEELRNLFWNYSGVDTEPGVRRTHTFKIGTTKPAPLTYEVSGTEANGEIYAGAYIRRAGFAFEAAGQPTFEREFVSKAPASAAKSGGPAFADLNTLLIKPAQVVINDGAATPCDSFTCNIDAGIDEGQVKLQGSSDIIEPEVTGDALITGSFRRNYNTATMQTKFADATTAVISLTATGPTLGAGNYSFTLSFAKAVILGDPVVHENKGIVFETINFQAEDDATDSACKLIVVNSEALLT